MRARHNSAQEENKEESRARSRYRVRVSNEAIWILHECVELVTTFGQWALMSSFQDKFDEWPVLPLVWGIQAMREAPRVWPGVSLVTSSKQGHRMKDTGLKGCKILNTELGTRMLLWVRICQCQEHGGLCENFGIKSCNHTHPQTNISAIKQTLPLPRTAHPVSKQWCDTSERWGIVNAFYLDPDNNKILIQFSLHKTCDLHSPNIKCVWVHRLDLSLYGDILNRVNRDDSEIQFAINILCPICN